MMKMKFYGWWIAVKLPIGQNILKHYTKMKKRIVITVLILAYVIYKNYGQSLGKVTIIDSAIDPAGMIEEMPMKIAYVVPASPSLFAAKPAGRLTSVPTSDV